MTWLALGAAIFCGYAVWALACELAAEWLMRRATERATGRALKRCNRV